MSDPRVMLSCRNVSIRYQVGDFKNIGLKEWVMRRLTGRYKVVDFWADRSITFSIDKGDMLGIIGSNGVEICKKHGMDLTDKRIKIVHGWSARKLAALPGTGMTEEQVKALEAELNAANL